MKPILGKLCGAVEKGYVFLHEPDRYVYGIVSQFPGLLTYLLLVPNSLIDLTRYEAAVRSQNRR